MSGITRRPKWRSNKRKDTAVKVYTVAMESRYLLIFNVPIYANESDLIHLIKDCGEIEYCEKVTEEYTHEEFTDVYSIKVHNLTDARNLKKKCDETLLIGNHLHIQYAPEKESPEETKAKFTERRFQVTRSIELQKNQKEKAMQRGLTSREQLESSKTKSIYNVHQRPSPQYPPAKRRR